MDNLIEALHRFASVLQHGQVHYSVLYTWTRGIHIQAGYFVAFFNQFITYKLTNTSAPPVTPIRILIILLEASQEFRACNEFRVCSVL